MEREFAAQTVGVRCAGAGWRGGGSGRPSRAPHRRLQCRPCRERRLAHPGTPGPQGGRGRRQAGLSRSSFRSGAWRPSCAPCPPQPDTRVGCQVSARCIDQSSSCRTSSILRCDSRMRTRRARTLARPVVRPLVFARACPWSQWSSTLKVLVRAAEPWVQTALKRSFDEPGLRSSPYDRSSPTPVPE